MERVEIKLERRLQRHSAESALRRLPKPCVTRHPSCSWLQECFFHVFETEVHNTIVQHGLFKSGQRVAIGASGGKGPFELAREPRLLGVR